LLEWAVTEPSLFNHIIPIATNAQHSPWAIAFNAAQRISIETDETWKEKNEQAGINGMKAARSIALLSYRNYETYQTAQAETNSAVIENFKSDSYQRYQGEKLARRFNAFSYYFLSQSMDSHNIGRGRESVELALKTIEAKTLVIGISSDILFPPHEQELLAANIPNAELNVIYSTYGHDGFLLEFEQMEKIIINFLKKSSVQNKAALLNN
jgi:homoserine O-acetyltransferase